MFCNSQNAAAVVLERLSDERCVFVFPSESAAQAYAVYAVTAGGREAVCANRFIAWDTFKKRSIKYAANGEDGKKSISPVMRKMFAVQLLEANRLKKQEGRNTFFTTIIPGVYAGYSTSFSSWVAGILPQLALWSEKFAKTPVSGVSKINIFNDGIQKDLQTLTIQYQLFLDKNNLFESAWMRPPFVSDGNTYFIFYPEAIDDFIDYKELLENAQPYVKIINVPKTSAPQKSFFYKSAQSEIIEAALYILQLHKNGVSYRDILISIPAVDDYQPYIEKEFYNRGVPLVNKNGKPLTAYPAGRLFLCIQDCYTKKFSFDSVVSLLTNRALPWKEPSLIDKLIDFGLKNTCICSWEENGETVDVWKNAGFSSEDISVFYSDLKKAVSLLCRSKTFADVKKYYFAFRKRFLNIRPFEEWLPADAVISRCVSELSALVNISRAFPDVKISNCYSFWVKHLSETIYTPQSNFDGVVLLPYKIASALPADYHIVLGANQNDMAQVNTRFDFLPKSLRQSANIESENTSEVFFNLHKVSAQKETVFFCSEQTFSGFAIPFSLLNLSNPRLRYAQCKGCEDFFYADLAMRERERFLRWSRTGTFDEKSVVLHKAQKTGFAAFADANSGVTGCGPEGAPGLKERFTNESREIVKFAANRFFREEEGRPAFFVSASVLKPFYECSLKWFFQRILRVRPLEMEASIFDPSIWGILYHAVFNSFFTYIKDNHRIFEKSHDDNLSYEWDSVLIKIIDEHFSNMDEILYTSVLKKKLMHPQKEKLYVKIKEVIKKMAACFDGCYVFLVEENLKTDFSKIPVNGFSVYLDGKPDLVLKDKDENYILVDFKSSTLPEKRDCFGDEDSVLFDFQMPVYYELLGDNYKKNAGSGVFVNINEGDVKTYFSPGKKGRERTVPFAEVLDPFKIQTVNYAKAVLSGDIASYINKKNKACGACDYKNICRRRNVLKKDGLFEEKLTAANVFAAGGGREAVCL
ncbi:MAG: PD-(D/E)XK nuclease family protein [Spirochaetaceae bacterium]|jgi:hypothetical protein|nr:PD-(D/E)XK nuclease family protein [Spirochaetaceae bacterium]